MVCLSISTDKELFVDENEFYCLKKFLMISSNFDKLFKHNLNVRFILER